MQELFVSVLLVLLVLIVLCCLLAMLTHTSLKGVPAYTLVTF
jgi:hypothetical protein